MAHDGVPAARRPAVPRAAPTSPGTASWSCSARSAGPGRAAPAGPRATPPPSWPTPSGPARPCPVGAGSTERHRAAPASPRLLLVAAADTLLGPLRPRVGRLRPGAQVPSAGHAGAAAAGRRPAPGRSDVATALTTTLDAMAAGGIYDHLGGGFARYSTDRRWLVPHFEKMLYDNALLARVYLHAWQLTGADRYRQVVDRDPGVPAAPAHAPARAAAWPRPRTPTARARRAASTSGTRPRCSRWAAGPPPSGTGSPRRATGRDATSCAGRFGRQLVRPPEVEAARAGAVRPPGGAGPARPRRQGADRMERHGGGRPGRGGRRLRRPRWVARRRGARRLPARPPAPAADGRWLRSWQAGAGDGHAAGAGPPPGLRRRLRLAGRGVHPPGRGDRTGPLDRRRPPTPRTRCWSCSSTASRGRST